MINGSMKQKRETIILWTAALGAAVAASAFAVAVIKLVLHHSGGSD
jgi:hypothetical protein